MRFSELLAEGTVHTGQGRDKKRFAVIADPSKGQLLDLYRKANGTKIKGLVKGHSLLAFVSPHLHFDAFLIYQGFQAADDYDRTIGTPKARGMMDEYHTWLMIDDIIPAADDIPAQIVPGEHTLSRYRDLPGLTRCLGTYVVTLSPER